MRSGRGSDCRRRRRHPQSPNGRRCHRPGGRAARPWCRRRRWRARRTRTTAHGADGDSWATLNVSNRSAPSGLNALDALAIAREGAVSEPGSWTELRQALQAVYGDLGRPSFRAIERRSRRAEIRISVGTAQSLASGGNGRPQRRSVEGFLSGLGVAPDDRVEWLAAWDRLAAAETAARFTPVRGPEDPAGAIGAALEQAMVSATAAVGGRSGLPVGNEADHALLAKLAEGDVRELIAYFGTPDFRWLVPQIVLLSLAAA